MLVLSGRYIGHAAGKSIAAFLWRYAAQLVHSDGSRATAPRILSGIGFIGPGAIIKQGASVTGVTTAAPIWFVTVLGLLFGAGNVFIWALLVAPPSYHFVGCEADGEASVSRVPGLTPLDSVAGALLMWRYSGDGC
jgi:hypothetical protein